MADEGSTGAGEAPSESEPHGDDTADAFPDDAFSTDAFSTDAFSDDERIRRLLVRELGEELANAFVVARDTQERWERRRHPDDGLRERKKRRTRQQISDVATTLFVVRGFDHVTVSQIADIVGVSEKTVYNYFPTKESLVFDRTDETIERLVRALRERAPGESPTKAVLRALGEDMDDLEDLPDELYMFFPLFSEMVAATPALRAAWLDLQGRLVDVATEELAALADVDPRDPEPMVAARAIVALTDLSFASRMRHIERGLRGRELRGAVVEDLERAARLLDAGLWSFNLLTQGARTRKQMREAAAAAEDARRQVFDALAQARAAWRELAGHERAGDERAGHERAGDERAQSRRGRDDLRREEREEVRRARTAARGVRAEARREAAELGRAAKELAHRAAYETFRETLQERHEAISARAAAMRRAAEEAED
jgi:AcrR family transcriptional regulator